MGTDRETNTIINNIGYVHFPCSELPCPAKKSKQVCVSKLHSAKKRSDGNAVLFFYVSNRHEQVL